MKYLSRHSISIPFLLAVCLFLSACRHGESGSSEKNVESLSYDHTEISAMNSEGADVFVWTAYWDAKRAFRTIYSDADSISSVGTFAAYYTEDGELMLPEETRQLSVRLSHSEKTGEILRYLTVVNDTESEQKNLDLTAMLLDDETSCEKTASAIVQMAEEYHYDGVEVDFEKIRSDLNLWNQFIRFEEQLYRLCQEKGLRLRIVLEPSTPVEDIRLPQEPEYVVMCYNLHGTGSEPGPKADAEFLKEMVKKFARLKHISYALANGGFDFDGSGDAKSITYDDAEKLLLRYGKESVRDRKSGALYFQYGSHTVWYADEQTLVRWMKVLQTAAGKKISVSLWRI